MKEILKVNFIWCGISDAARWNHVADAIQRKAIALKAFFLNYQLVVTLWTDGNFPARNLCNLQAKLGFKTVNVKSVFELFDRIEEDLSIANTIHKRTLRYIFSYELGCIAPYEQIGRSGLIDSYKPMPAMAADIIKLLLSYLEPGLFLDIGLSVTLPIDPSSGYKDADLSRTIYKYLSKDRKFIYPFALVELDNFRHDIQILYSSEQERSKFLYRKLIEAFTAPELILEEENRLDLTITYVKNAIRQSNNPCDLRTYRNHDNLPISDTYSIILRVIDKHYGSFADLLWGKNRVYGITLSEKDINGNAFAGLAFKERGDSFIENYKKTKSNRDVRDFLINKINMWDCVSPLDSKK